MFFGNLVPWYIYIYIMYIYNYIYTYYVYIYIYSIYIIIYTHIMHIYIYMPTKLLLIHPHKPSFFPCVHMFCLIISTSKTNLVVALILNSLSCCKSWNAWQVAGESPHEQKVYRGLMYVSMFILSYHILSCRILSYLSVYLSEFVYLSIYPWICKIM